MNTKKIADDPSKFDWSQFDAITDAEAEAQALADPDNFDTSNPSSVMARVQVIRRALDLTQEEFSTRYQIPLGTLRDWEQHRSEPSPATRAYLKVIASDPEWVAKALRGETLENRLPKAS